MLYKNTNSNGSGINGSTNRYPTPRPKSDPIGLNKQTGIFSAKLAGALGAGGYGVNKINDLNDHQNNISDFGHVGKVLGIGENEGIGSSIGTAVVASSEAMPAVGGGSILLKDKSPLDFKDKLKKLKSRRIGLYNIKTPI